MIEVIVTQRNAGEYTRQCLESLLVQDHDSYRITWVDDASDPGDQAATIATEMLNLQKHRVVLRSHRLGGIRNFYELACGIAPGSVVMSMGGDDYLLRPDALSTIASCYEDENCWYTHGASWNSDQSGSFSHPALHDDFREHPFYWLPSTWRSELTSKVLAEDLQLSGNWFPSSGDVALYTPILEMCGIERLRFIEQTFYMYRKHADNDGAKDQRLQDFMGWMARCKPKYSKLASLTDTPMRTPHVMAHGLTFAPQLPHAVPVICTVNGDKVELSPCVP